MADDVPAQDASEVRFWNEWNTSYRDGDLPAVSEDQSRVVLSWLRGATNLRLLDAGCGSGWMTSRLVDFGDVVGTDLADEVVARARERTPQARFVAGDIMTVDVGASFDVVVSLELLSHIPDQRGFVRRLDDWLVPGGRLILATQNRPVLQHLNRIPPPAPGQRRHWVSRRELKDLLASAGFDVEEMRTLTPQANWRPARYAVAVAKRLHLTPALERLGLGWTIIVLARKPNRRTAV